MSKQIAGDILKKISEIKKNKSNNEKNSITSKDPFMGFDISKKGLNNYIKDDGSNSNLEELRNINSNKMTDIGSSKLDVKKELKEFRNENNNSNLVNNIKGEYISGKNNTNNVIKNSNNNMNSGFVGIQNNNSKFY